MQKLLGEAKLCNFAIVIIITFVINSTIPSSIEISIRVLFVKIGKNGMILVFVIESNP